MSCRLRLSRRDSIRLLIVTAVCPEIFQRLLPGKKIFMQEERFMVCLFQTGLHEEASLNWTFLPVGIFLRDLAIR